MDKKTLPIIIVLALLIIFYYPLLQMLGLYEPPPPEEKTADTTSQAESPISRDDDGKSQSLSEQPPLTFQSDDAYKTDTAGKANETTRIDTVKIVTNKYEVSLSSYGGGLVSLLLKEYSYGVNGQIDMLSLSKHATPDFTFAGETFSASSVHYTSTKSSGTYYAESEPFEVTYRYQYSNGAELIKQYKFFPDEYHFDLIVEIRNREQFGFERQYQIVWNTPLGVTEPQVEQDYEEMAAVAMMGDSRVMLDDYEDDKLDQTLDGVTHWAGLRSKYFASVIIPRNRASDRVFARGQIGTVMTTDGPVEAREIIAGLNLPIEYASSFADSFTIFVGPMDYNLLSDYDVGLEDILGIGTTPYIGWLIRPFAIAIVWILPKMYDIIPNYGIVIILFALLVKLITLPLSLKSFKSMQAMKDIQPKLEELKKRHKKDPQALNKEMMKLYKKHGVNPISGCLPMLPQMPLFFALFSVFRSTILLREAPFVWFIDDLSRGASSLTDPYILLVLVMIGAQFVSQKITMASTQQNKMLMYVMPLFMGFIFYSFAAGLVLYWTSFSVFSLLDYAFFKRPKANKVETA